MNRAVVGVGSNTHPDRNIPAARALISREQCLVTESRYLTTRPVKYEDQADFANGAMLVDTELDQGAFKEYLQSVESRLGRTRTVNRNGPRTI